MAQKKDLQQIQDELATGEYSAANVLAEFEKADLKQLQQLNAEYLNLKENTVYNFIFAGMTTFENKQGGTVEAVELYDKNKQKSITGMTLIVKALKKVEQLPCLVKIVTKKFEDGDKGKYLDMDIYTVPINKKVAGSNEVKDLPFD